MSYSIGKIVRDCPEDVKANISNAFGLVGVATLLSFAVKSVGFVWKYFLRPFPSLKHMYGNDSWAVVTGGSAGIGLEMARILADEGMNVVLVARNANNLKEAAKAISERNPSIQVRIIPCDAANPVYPLLVKGLEDLNISLLINNVGVHNDIPTNVEDMTHSEVQRIIAVNCAFQVNFTSLVIPMLRRKRPSGKRTTIVNVSSLTSQMDMPMLSVYAATKAFEEHFSSCLAAELLQTDGVEVLCVRPGITVSKMSGISQPSFFCPSAATMAQACLHKLGCGQLCVAPYWPHALLDVVNGLVPRTVGWPVVRKMHAEKRDALLKEAKMK